jgi:hypothetical protein
MASNDLPIPTEGFLLAHSIVAEDLARSRDFYAGVLGGQVILDGEPTILKLANSWVMINLGGGRPTTRPRSCSSRRATPPGPAPSSTCASPTSSRLPGLKREGSGVPHPTQGLRQGDPLLHPRP